MSFKLTFGRAQPVGRDEKQPPKVGRQSRSDSRPASFASEYIYGQCAGLVLGCRWAVQLEAKEACLRLLGVHLPGALGGSF